MTVNIAALQGKKDDVQFARFSCVAVTDSAKDVLRTIKNDHPEASVFAKFTLSGLDSESFTYPPTSKRAGERGVNLKSMLMDLKILTVDGERLADQTKSSKDDSSTKEEHEIQEALAATIDEQNSDQRANKIDEEDDIAF